MTEMVVVVDRELYALLPTFLKGRWNDLAAMRAQIGKGDFAALGSLGHKLSGSPGAFGYTFLVDLGRKIEAAAEKKDTGELNRLADVFEKFLKEHKVRIEGGSTLYEPANL